jgi:hypothetical protein
MKKNTPIHRILLVLFLLVFVPLHDALAYTDPGTATWLLQILLAAAITGFLTLKSFWKKTVNFLKKLFHIKSSGK